MRALEPGQACGQARLRRLALCVWAYVRVLVLPPVRVQHIRGRGQGRTSPVNRGRHRRWAGSCCYTPPQPPTPPCPPRPHLVGVVHEVVVAPLWRGQGPDLDRHRRLAHRHCSRCHVCWRCYRPTGASVPRVSSPGPWFLLQCRSCRTKNPKAFGSERRVCSLALRLLPASAHALQNLPVCVYGHTQNKIHVTPWPACSRCRPAGLLRPRPHPASPPAPRRQRLRTGQSSAGPLPAAAAAAPPFSLPACRLPS